MLRWNQSLVALDGYKKGNLGRAGKPHATLANHFASTMSRYPLPGGTQLVFYTTVNQVWKFAATCLRAYSNPLFKSSHYHEKFFKGKDNKLRQSTNLLKQLPVLLNETHQAQSCSIMAMIGHTIIFPNDNNVTVGHLDTTTVYMDRICQWFYQICLPLLDLYCFVEDPLVDCIFLGAAFTLASGIHMLATKEA